MAHAEFVPASPECSKSAFGTIESSPGLVRTIAPPPGLECAPLLPQSDAGTVTGCPFALCQRIGLPPGLAVETDVFSAGMKMASSSRGSDQSTASDEHDSDGRDCDCDSSCAESLEDAPVKSRLSADAPVFVPCADSSRDHSELDSTSRWRSWQAQSVTSPHPVKVPTNFVGSVSFKSSKGGGKPSSGNAACPAQIIPTTSWIAAARAAMPQSESCNKVSTLRSRVSRCQGCSRLQVEDGNESAMDKLSWAAIVKGRGPSP
eukprot:TRINITY_DN2693_c0_g3_i1.p1 TRINITY_DN2693_c0_g3~~TRINITY_DN2693_c0_g3_i1.p1  ORF type:complete len:285 (-),score=23.60 TRINITY_DN2693_c0_g3_i1:77-859(-)